MPRKKKLTTEFVKNKRLMRKVSGLRAQRDEKMVAYEIEACKIAPDNHYSGRYGYGLHMPGGYYGPRGYGMGYALGTCWNNLTRRT